MKKYYVKLCAMITISFLSAQYVNAVVCDSEVLKKTSVHNLPGAGYWMQAFGNCRVTYTTVGGISSKLYNICTNESERITDHIDAFPVPLEDNLYTHPYGGIGFFKLSDVLGSDGRSDEPFYDDMSHTGNYQSLGLLPSSTPDKKVIRVAMGNAAGRFRDYTIEKINNGRDFKIKPVQSQVMPVCKNLESGGLDTEVPVLSRDGQMISGRVLESRKTGIFRINATDGSCTLVKKIPTQTSKVSFSFDNKHVMYTMRDPNTHNGRLIQMNLETGELRSVSGPDEDVQYMTSRPDGTILYTKHAPVVVTEQNGSIDSYESTRTSRLVILDSKLVAETPNKKIYEAIGLLWADKCGRDIDLDYAQTIGQRMLAENCSELINRQSVATLEAEYGDITVSQLKSVCGTNQTVQSTEQSVKQRTVEQPKPSLRDRWKQYWNQ